MVYENALRSAKGLSYADVAKQFGVTRVEVCQYVTIVRRLPAAAVTQVQSETDARRLRSLLIPQRAGRGAIHAAHPRPAPR